MSFESDLIDGIEDHLAIEMLATYPASALAAADYHAVIANGVAKGVYDAYGTGGGGGGGATLPIVLTTDVSGILPVANGGTGSSSLPAGGLAGLTGLAAGDAASVATAAADATTKANAAQAAAIAASDASGAAAAAQAAAATDATTKANAAQAAAIAAAATDATTKANAAQALAGVFELSIVSGLQVVTSTTFTRVGARPIAMGRFPNITGYTRHVRLLCDVDKSSGSTSGDVQLIDVTHAGVLVTATNMSTTSNANEEKDSGDLTVGSGSGNIRSDVDALYELQMKRIGGVQGTDAVSITNARLLIYYT